MTAFLFIIPTVILLVTFMLFPIGYLLYLSFNTFEFSPSNVEMTFVGLENYKFNLQSEFFHQTIGVSTYFTILDVSLGLILSLIVALVLNEEFRGQRTIRGLIILPWAIPSVVNGLLWKWIYNAEYGFLNGLLWQLGIIHDYKVWLAEPAMAINLVLVATLWTGTPFAIMYLLAAIQSIPTDLYESAKIDGAGVWHRFRHVTLPLLKPALIIITILRTMWAIQSFDLIYVITGGGPAGTTSVIAYYTWLLTFRYLEFGHGSALSVILTAIVLILSVIYTRSLYKTL